MSFSAEFKNGQAIRRWYNQRNSFSIPESLVIKKSTIYSISFRYLLYRVSGSDKQLCTTPANLFFSFITTLLAVSKFLINLKVPVR